MRDLVDGLAIMIWSNSENNPGFGDCEKSDGEKLEK
jgi:hypothetical protein